MDAAATLLGFLEAGPSHGYDLKRRYDRWFGRSRPLRFGQVYATLARLLRDERIRVGGIEQVEGPERRIYQITARGVEELERWLDEPLPAPIAGQDELFVKVILALRSGRDAERILNEQRAAHLHLMRQLTTRKRQGDLMDAIAIDRELFHLEADLRWIALTSDRIERLRKELAT